MGNPSRRKPAPGPSRKRAPTIADVEMSPLLKGAAYRQARTIWARIAPDLSRNNMLAPSDVDALARYCIHLEEWSTHTATLRKEGSTQEVKTTSGDVMIRLHPAAKLREIAEKRLLDLEDRFGLNPRHRLAILRDMGALQIPLGDLFSRSDVSASVDKNPVMSSEAMPAAREEDDDIIGFARRPPPGTLPN